MIGELFLSLALGQAGPAPQAAPQAAPARATPTSVGATPGPVGNLTSSTGETLVPNGDGTYRVGTASTAASTTPTNDTPASKPAVEEAEAEEPETKYFAEKLLEGSVAGQLLSDNGIKVYGWVAMNYSGSSARRSNLPVTFNDRANYYQLNQNYLVLEKGIDTEKDEVQYGFQTDLILPGTDSRLTISRGLLDQQLRGGQNGTPNSYPIDLFQAFGTVFLPDVGAGGTTVKAGKFATFLGYEVVQAPLGPFVTKSYLFQYNPFTHTGVLATTQVNDDVSIGYGAATGNDVFIDPAARATFLGFVRYAPKDGPTTAQFGVSATNPKFFTRENFAHYNAYNFLLTHKFTDNLQYVADSWFSHIDNAPNGIGSTNWYGVAQYLIYTHSDQVTSNLRFELFNDTSGFRTGTEGLYTAVTYGITYAPDEALLIRPFARYDHNKNGPFEGKENLYTGGVELIVRY